MVNKERYFRLLETELRNVGLDHELIQGLYKSSYSGHVIVRYENRMFLGLISYRRKKVVAEIISEPQSLDEKIVGLMHAGLDIRVVDPSVERDIYAVIRKIRFGLQEDANVTRAYFYERSR